MRGAARWLPPGRAGDARRRRCCARSSRRRFALGAATGPFLAYGRAVEALRADVAGGPHWYLAGIGVDPAAQRQGIGTALLQPGLERGGARAACRRVLLTNNEANLAVLRVATASRSSGEGRTPEDGPNAWVMVRRP